MRKDFSSSNEGSYNKSFSKENLKNFQLNNLSAKRNSSKDFVLTKD